MSRSTIGEHASGLPAAGSRVQGPTSDFPVLHLEGEIPEPGWDVVVDGLVRTPVTLSEHAIRSMIFESRSWDLHCVSGWSKLECLWEGGPRRPADRRGPPAI